MTTPPLQTGTQLAEEFALLGHDIRSALMDLTAGLALINEQHLDPADRLQLDRAKATGESLTRYLEEGLTTLLAQAPIELPLLPTDLNQLLTDMMRRWSVTSDPAAEAVTLTTHDLPAAILCNHTAVDRVLSNLISNAITHSGGKAVAFTVTHPTPETLCFNVADQGPGLPPHRAQRSINSSALPAWQDRQGHGLGLSIAHILAERMGGTLRLYDQPSGGAAAEFVLPITVIKAPLPQPFTDRIAGKKILIADDSMPQLLLLSKYLRDHGAAVTMLRDGRAAETALRNDSFDLALLDLEMPGRSGLEICTALRDHSGPNGKTTPVIILTAHALSHVQQSALAAGAERVVAKPITSAHALIEALCQPITAETPPPATLSKAAFNPAAFLRLLDLAGHDLAVELLARYHEDLTTVQGDLITGLAADDWPTLSKSSHILIALSGTAGMTSLETDSRAFNLAANTHDSVALAKHKDAVLNGLATLLDFVTQIAQERHSNS